MLSAIPFLALGALWYYLSRNGTAFQTLWLLLNIFDTLRALRQFRPNGRRIGIATRRKVMRDSLLCWTVYILVTTVLPTFEMLFSWIPLFGTIEVILAVVFFATRVPTSIAIYDSAIKPIFRRYEIPIDLTVLLFQSLAALIGHYAIQIPKDLIREGCRALRSLAIQLIVDNEVPEVRPGADVGNVDQNDDDVVVITSTRAGRHRPRPNTIGAPAPRMRSSSPEILSRAPTPSYLTSLANKATLTEPSTPKRLPQSQSQLLQVPTAPSALRRSPRRYRATDATEAVAIAGSSRPSSSVVERIARLDPTFHDIDILKKTTVPPSRSKPDMDVERTIDRSDNDPKAVAPRPSSRNATKPDTRPTSRSSAPSARSINIPSRQSSSSIMTVSGREKPRTGVVGGPRIPESRSSATLIRRTDPARSTSIVSGSATHPTNKNLYPRLPLPSSSQSTLPRHGQKQPMTTAARQSSSMVVPQRNLRLRIQGMIEDEKEKVGEKRKVRERVRDDMGIFGKGDGDEDGQDVRVRKKVRVRVEGLG